MTKAQWGLVVVATATMAVPTLRDAWAAEDAEQRVQSIAGTGQRSIAGTGQRSIAGTGQRSIAGTGQRSIAGTGQRSIAGTGQRSIAGTGQRSIAGTGQRSIAGTGQRSIAGTGQRSIAGTGQRSIAGTGQRSIAGTGLRSFVEANDAPSLILFGPVLSVTESTVNVLGVELSSSASVAAADVGKSAYAEIVEKDGTLTLLTFSPTNDLAVPGASSVFVSGTVESVSDTGQVTISGLAIDANSVGLSDIRIGAAIAIGGIQPVPGGLILGQTKLDLGLEPAEATAPRE